MALASVVGLGAEIGLGVGGVLAGYALCNDRDELFGCSGHASVGMLTGGMLGAIGGVQLTADAMGGDGKLWATTLGGVGGTAVGLAGFVALYVSDVDYDDGYVEDDDGPGLALLPLLVGPVPGSCRRLRAQRVLAWRQTKGRDENLERSRDAGERRRYGVRRLRPFLTHARRIAPSRRGASA